MLIGWGVRELGVIRDAPVRVLTGRDSAGSRCGSAPACPDDSDFSAEAGLLSLADVSVDYIEITSLKDWDETYKWAKSSAEAKQYATMGLDTLA